jgi:aldehyde:ferredoxin oxidoreductase
MDSLILCKFLRGVFHDFYSEAAELLQAVTGWPYISDELRIVAKRIVNARKCLNQREGWTAAEDTLPPRLLDDPLPESDEPLLSRARLEAMIEAYYQNRGWDSHGRVPMKLRTELGIVDKAFGDPSNS